MSDRARVLLVDDNADDRSLASLVLRERLGGFQVEEAGDPVSFAENLASGGFSVAIVSERLSWGDGLRALGAIQNHLPDCLLFLLVAPGRALTSERASALGLDGWLPKDSHGFLALPEAIRRAQAGDHATGDDGKVLRLVEALPLGVFLLSPHGTVTYANRAVAEMAGVRSGRALVGRDVASLFPGVDMGPRWERLFAERGRLNGVETRVQLRQGQWRRARIDVWPEADLDGGLSHYNGTVQDLSPLEATDRELARQTGALRRSNEELQQLAYVVSHDLQAPLNLVSRHARLLSERCASRLDEDSRRFLGHLVGNAERMQSMLDDVLAYFRFGRQAGGLESVDFGGAVDEAAANLSAVAEESGARVRHNLLPTLSANRRQIVQLFQNLISNALKFRGEDPPRIVITAKEREDDWCFAVKDNGIGIDASQASRVFGLFQRLHTAEEYPGTGIGLAICKRIVERHGGQIWVSSMPGRGSTFFLSIPKRPVDDTPSGMPEGAYERHEA